MKNKFAVLLILAIFAIAPLALTSCSTPGGAQIASNTIASVEQWALPIANDFINSWIHSHLGASPKSVSVETKYVDSHLDAAKKAFPNASDADLRAGLSHAYQAALANRSATQ